MSHLTGKEIQTRAADIIRENPGGIRYSVLVEQINRESPETPVNAIRGVVWNLDEVLPKAISKPSRGVFKPLGIAGDETVVSGATDQIVSSLPNFKELDLYKPFAQYLKNDLDEVTDAAPLGGAGLKSRWGTPDVIGVYKPVASNLIKFDPEIVSAEIKKDPRASIVAFGQAVSYRLFSAKTYIVMPATLSEEDLSRLESLCLLFGVGLVLFDIDKDIPNFSIRVRAQRFPPDMFYVNKFADDLKLLDRDVFENLF
jgi:hypothetical protein